MEKIRLSAYGKINISLDVIGRKLDGYHLVSMIMQSVTLCDYVTVAKSEYEGIHIVCEDKSVPLGKENIAYKAAEKIIKRYGIKQGVEITIEKNIPMAAGMAGGSTDAAAVIKGMNAVFGLNLSENELDVIAVTIGADVPYCLRSGTYLAQGIGEKLTKLKDIPRYELVIVNPNLEVGTKEIYAEIDMCENISHPQTEKLLDSINNGHWKELFMNMGNVLEPVTKKKCKDIELLEKKMIELGALGSLMTGSGPTVFGVFDNINEAETATDYFEKNYANGRAIRCAVKEQE